MSEESVEIVRRTFAEFERGNFWLPEVFDPEIRIKWLGLVGGEVETVGREEMSAFLRDWLESWERLTLSAERFIDAGDHVVVFQTWRGIGKSSGLATEWQQGTVWTLRQGKVISVDGYNDRAEALEAAGLPPDQADV